MERWIGVDLDGTLAEYYGWKGPLHIGAPIPEMVDRVKKMLEDGVNVRIMTARISHDNTSSGIIQAQISMTTIMEWCDKHLGQVLPVTNVKDYGMVYLWDDRAIGIIKNHGERCCERNAI